MTLTKELAQEIKKQLFEQVEKMFKNDTIIRDKFDGFLTVVWVIKLVGIIDYYEILY